MKGRVFFLKNKYAHEYNFFVVFCTCSCVCVCVCVCVWCLFNLLHVIVFWII